MVEGEYSMILVHITLVLIGVDKNPLDVVARELKINRCLQRWKV